MNGPAEIRVRGETGTFIAETCTVAGGLVTATGQRRYLVGANYSEMSYGPLETVSWPVSRIGKIKWLSPVA